MTNHPGMKGLPGSWDFQCETRKISGKLGFLVIPYALGKFGSRVLALNPHAVCSGVGTEGSGRELVKRTGRELVNQS